MDQKEKAELVYKPDYEIENVLDSKEIKIGTVVDCVMLNVRKEPVDGVEIVCEIDCRTELIIDENKSTDDFFKVYM